MSVGQKLLIGGLKAAGEPTRLRILALLRHGDLAVGELARILDQSQPRLSHHLKSLTQAGLVERLPEGAWVFYRIQRRGWAERLLQGIFSKLDVDSDPFTTDFNFLQRVRANRAQSAASYFSHIAKDWDQLRALHYPDAAIEREILGHVECHQFERIIDLGTGTGRILVLLAPYTQEAEGLDLSHRMLKVARANLNRAGIGNARVRQGNAMNTPFESDSADLVIVHQVLHYLEQPEKVIAEAARILKQGGQLIVVDFAPHKLEFLRESQGHYRLGISEDDMMQWADKTGFSIQPPRRFDPPSSLDKGISVLIWKATWRVSQPADPSVSKLSVAEQQSKPPPNVSFEFFPPKSDSMEAKLWESVARLTPMAPRFVSVTYGAGGSTRDRTRRIVTKIAQDTPLLPAAHLTCVGATKEEVLGIAVDLWKAGIRHIVALRGDPPEGIDAKFEQHPGGFRDSIDLIEGIRNCEITPGARIEISVSCYPEQHPHSRGWDQDIAFLRAKQDAGADRAITQFFFEPEVYFKFLDRARAGGVTMPIVPGIMLQPNFKGMKRIADLCQVTLPDWLYEVYAGTGDDTVTREFITANVAAELCHKLSDQGVNEFHFYTLNRASLALSTCRLLGLKPQTVG